MSDHNNHGHGNHGTGEAHPDMFRLYIMVFIALSIATAVSFGAYSLFGQGSTSLTIIMIVSVIKASLVAYIFMHLKYDWGKVVGIMIPVVVMAIMFVIVLLPDIVFGWGGKKNPESAAVPGKVR